MIPPGMKRPARVLIGMPTVDWMWSRAALGLWRLARSRPPGTLDLAMTLGGTTIAQKRNSCVRHFLAGSWDWLFFLDSDMEPPAISVIDRLIAHDVDIVGATAFLRGPPFTVAAGTLEGGWITEQECRGQLMAADWVGGACLLIRRRVVERLADPWFVAEDREDMHEDRHFCRTARAAGFSVWLDTAIVFGHLAVQSVDAAFAAIARERGAR